MEITVKNEIDPGRICRACLSSENNLREMLETDEDYVYFLETYKTFTSVDLKEITNLPLHVCEVCLVRIEEFNTFREMCLKSHSIIQTLVMNISSPMPEELLEEKVPVSEDQFVVVNSDNVDSLDIKYDTQSDTEMQKEQEEHEEIMYTTEEINIKDKFSCEICCETFDDLKTFGEHHEAMHSTKDYKCSFCLEAFNHPALLTRHIKTHKSEIPATDMKLYQCGRCEKSYKTLLNLQIHVYSHTGLKPYKCEHCPKAFTKQSALLTHNKIHTGAHSHLCSECGKGFNTGLLLKRHKASHSGLRPFKCKFCPSSFVSPRDLTVHMRTHTGEKPYLCSTCGKSFRRANHLNVHKRTHTGEKPYECSFCGKCFSQSGDRNAHERIHTGNKPHICTQCNKRFNHTTALMMHKRTHQQSSFTCQTCDKRFLKVGSFEKHLLTHMQEESSEEESELS